MPTHATTDTPAHPPLITPAFVALSLASLAYFTSAGMTLPALPRLVEGPLGGGNLAVGVTFGAFSVSAVLLRPLAGVYGDQRGRRPLIVVGALIAAAAVMAYGLAPNVPVLVALRLVSGIGEALFFVGMLTTFADLAPPERRGEAMSLASLGLYLGIGIGPLLAEAVARVGGLGMVWIAAGVVGCGAAALGASVPETRPDVSSTPAAAPARGLRRFVHPAGLLPGTVLFASIVGMAAFLAFVPLHVLDIGLAGSGTIMAVFAGVVVVIRSAGARIPDRLGPVRAIRIALMVSASGLVVVAGWHALPGLVVGAVLLGVGVALLTPSVFALAAAAVPPAERGQVMATTSAFIDVAFGLGPMAMGVIAAWFGRPAVFAAGAVMAVAGLALLAITRPGAGAPRDERVVIRPPATSPVSDPA